jgi:hypothetical protein
MGGSEMDDGLILVQRAYRVCLPLVLVFIAREWGKMLCNRLPQPSSTEVSRRLTLPDDGESGADSQPARPWVGSATGRAIAGSVWARPEETSGATDPASGKATSNKALMLSYADVVNLYRKAGREAELHYAPPNTSVLVRTAGEEWR